MRKLLSLMIVYMAVNQTCHAQHISLKGSIIGVPTSSGGSYLGHLGLEYQLPDSRHTVELSYHMSRWSGISSDGPEPARKWVIAAVQRYLGKTEIRKSAFISFFTEAGSRKITPGFIHYTGDSILTGERAGEIAPGISAGKNFRLGKRWTIQAQAGPKLIFARYTSTYYHNISSTFTAQKHNEVNAGMRFQFSFCYQL